MGNQSFSTLLTLAKIYGERGEPLQEKLIKDKLKDVISNLMVMALWSMIQF